MPWNIILERAFILRFAPGMSFSQQGTYVEEESHFIISSVSAFSFPIFTSHRPPPIPHLKASSPVSPHFSYLIHNLGFSPQLASKLSSTNRLRFKTNQNPDLVLHFFRTHGFSDSQLRHIIAREPWLLSCDPSKRVLRKFLFFFSKGLSASGIVNLVIKCPGILSRSLDNHIVPTYEFLTTFLQPSHMDFTKLSPFLFSQHNVSHNVTLLIENGVPHTTITRLLRWHSEVLYYYSGLLDHVQEVKDLGFNPSQSTFSIALHAKTIVTEARWKEKVDAFKKWGWSDQHVHQAFRKYPHCMLTSLDKINIVMDFWVNHLGWDTMAIANDPRILGSSMKRKIIPRSSVVQYLLNKGLRKKKASLTTPFQPSNEMFIRRFITPFEEDSSYLLKLFQEKLNLAHDKDNKDGTI